MKSSGALSTTFATIRTQRRARSFRRYERRLKMKWLAKPLLSWQEPVLFSVPTRDRRGWVWRGALALGIAAVMMLGFYADRAWGGRGLKFGPVQSIALAAFIGVFLT